jgi:hypothetical protein
MRTVLRRDQLSVTREHSRRWSDSKVVPLGVVAAVVTALTCTVGVLGSAGAAVPVARPADEPRFGTQEDCTGQGTCLPSGRVTGEFYGGSGDCIFTISMNWGDGTSSSYTTGGFLSINHQYQKPGVYTQTMSGSGSSPTGDFTCSFTPSTIVNEVPAPNPCRRTNFWGQGIEQRQMLRQFARDAQNAANAGYEWAKSFDLLGRLIDIAYPPGTTQNAEAQAIEQAYDHADIAQDVLDVHLQEKLAKARKAAAPVLNLEQALAAKRAEYDGLKSVAQQPLSTDLTSTDRRKAIDRRKQLGALIKEQADELAGLRSEYSAELTAYKKTSKQVAAVAAPTDEFLAFVKKLAGSSEPLLRNAAGLLEKTNTVQTIIQLPGAAGTLVWAPLAGIATAMSKPPPGCTTEPSKP